MMALIAAAMLAAGTPHYHLVPKDVGANLRFRREMLQMAGSDRRAAAQIKTMCSEDLLFYVNTFCWTYDPRPEVGGSKILPFVTYDFQDEAMRTIAECIESGEDVAMPKSRDMGASWIGLTTFEWFWHFRNNMSFLLISRNEDYVDKRGNPKSLFWKIDFLHEYQPKWLLPPGRNLGWSDPERTLLHLGNIETKSVLDGESTTGEAGRGDRRSAMFIDEHSAMSIDDGFRVLRSTRDTTNCRIFNATPQGANSAFYEVCHNTSARKVRLHWSRHPKKNLGLYMTENGKVKLLDSFRGMVRVMKKGGGESKRVMFPDEYPFRLDGKLRSPWYDNQCARCATDMEIAQELDIDFLGSDFQFFDPESIEALRKKNCRPPELIGDLEYDPETCEPKRFIENPKGNLSLWMVLDGSGGPATDRKFVLGADVSAGTGASNSVSVGVDRVTREKVAAWRNPNVRPNPFAKQSIALAKWLNRAFMIWDASGPTGEVFTKRVMASGYGNIYYRRHDKKIGRDVTDQPGYYLNPQARTALFEDYREALASQAYINRSDVGMRECLQYIRKPDGSIEHSSSANTQDPSGARSAHGDEVVADALASHVVGDKSPQAVSDEPAIPEGSLAYRMQKRTEAEKKKMSDGLGGGW